MKFFHPASLVALIFLLPYCVYAQPRAQFKVGVILPLTGPLAEFGIAAKNGFELARAEHGEELKNVEFLFDDSQYDSNKAISSFQKFRGSGDVSLAYVWGYGPNQAVIPIAETQKFPIVSISGDSSITAHKLYALRFCYRLEMIANALLDYARDHRLKHIAVIKAELAYMDGLFDYMKKSIKPGEELTVLDSYQTQDSTFKNSIVKLKAKKFDALAVFLVGGQISQFYREMKQLGLLIPTLGTDFYDSMKLVKDAQGTMTGSVFGAPSVEQTFVERYRKYFGNDAQVAWAANTYEFALLTSKLFGNETHKLSATQILDRFRSLKGEHGEAARYTYNDSSEAPGFDFKVVTRMVESDQISDLN